MSPYEKDAPPSMQDELTYAMRSIIRNDDRKTSVMHAVLKAGFPGQTIEDLARAVWHTPEQIQPVLAMLRETGWLRTEVTLRDSRQVELYSLQLPEE
jgi:hypothetical protein